VRIFNKFRNTRGFLSTAHNTLKWAYMITEKAKHKYRVLCFWEKHGLSATIEAFSVKKRTLYGWKKKLKKGGNKAEALNEKSKEPKTKRKRIWSILILNEIKRLRDKYPNLGKEKVYPELLLFCNQNKLKCPKPKTIGRLISDLGGLRKFPQKVSHFGKIKKVNRQKVLRKPKDFKPQYAGHLVALDTIEKFVHGVRRYVITFEDIYTRFAFAWSTSSHASLAAKEFFNICINIFPYPIVFVLTDNGSEFKKYFNEALNELYLTHFHTYPRTPKMNAHVERFNKTIQEEYIDYHLYELMDTKKFNHNLMDWLIWYNTRRVHYAFKNKLSPVQYMLYLEEQNISNSQKCKSRWPHTCI
jgi:transposase InsO family protein